MRIPTEHFTATPVFALSPSTNIANNFDNSQYKSMINGSTMQSASHQKPQSPQFASLCVTSCQKNNIPKSVQREKKISLPASLGLLGSQSVGSAPSSPTLSRTPSSVSRDAENPFMFPSSGINTSLNNSSSARPGIQTIFGSMSISTSSCNNESSGVPRNTTNDVVLRNKRSKENLGSNSKYATLPRK